MNDASSPAVLAAAAKLFVEIGVNGEPTLAARITRKEGM